MKKLIALLLAVVCILGVFAGCGGKGGNEGSNDGDGEKVTLTIGLPMDANVLDLDNNALTKYLEEKTGYDLKFQVYASGSEIATNITTTTLAGKALPDILFGIDLGSGSLRSFGENDYFLDLQDYFADRDGASKIFWDRLEENLEQWEIDDIVNAMTVIETGAIYAVPTLETSPIDIMDYQVWINQTWLDKLNLKMPTNVDELYNVLVAFKNNDCNGNGNKNDEIPLNGAMRGTRGSDVISWLINQYMYFDQRNLFNVDDNGKIFAGFTTDKYREAMKFINKLMKEGLLTDTALTNDNVSTSMVTTPADGVAKCGVFVGHLTLHTQKNNMLLKEYVPLKPMQGQTSVYNPNTRSMNCIITSDCKNPDEAFNLLMVMREEETSYRVRYGEYGVNWCEPDEGAISDMGLPCTVKILNDPFGTQNTCMWVSANGTFTINAEGESAQYAEGTTEWEKLRSKMHAESRANFDEAAKNNPKNICPSLKFTEAEKEETEFMRTEVGDIFTKYTSGFYINRFDPNDDTVWNKYVKEITEAGLNDYIALAQKAYDRQMANKTAE